MQYIFHEPDDYGFKDRDGHDGKFFDTGSPRTQHMIIECKDKLTVSLTQWEIEFNYYVIEGAGYFVINNVKTMVVKGACPQPPTATSWVFCCMVSLYM